MILSSTLDVTTGGTVIACGVAVGAMVGAAVGLAVGGFVGIISAAVGFGDVVGEWEGAVVGDSDAASDGIAVALDVGEIVGTVDIVGALVFTRIGAIVG